jgi:hypothetical protein
VTFSFYGIEEPMDRMVDSPPHYSAGEIECIDAIRAALGPQGFAAFCRGNALKYLWRAELKNASPTQDLLKAVWYTRMASGDDPRKKEGA